MTLCFVLASRALEKADFGRLAVLFNLLAMAAVFATAGQDTLVSRSWGEYTGSSRYELALGAIQHGFKMVTIVAVLVAIGTSVGVVALWAHPPLLALGAFLFVVLQAYLHFLSHLTRTMGVVGTSEFHREITWRAILLLAVASGLYLGFDVVSFIWSAVAGLFLACILQYFTMRRSLPQQVLVAKAAHNRQEWSIRGRAMWAAAGLEACSQYSEVVLLGVIAHPEETAAFFVATRIANLFAMISTGLHVATMSRSAALYFSADLNALQSVLRLVMTINLALIIPLFGLLSLFGADLLSLFGHQYREAYDVVLVLTISTASVAASGPSAGLLLTTGHEQFYLRTISIGLVARFLLICLLTPFWGALGAALGTAGVNVPMAVFLAAACRRKCNVDPSVFSILRPAIR